MFDLTPFDRNERKLMNLFDRFDRDFFGNFDQSLAAFRTVTLCLAARTAQVRRKRWRTDTLGKLYLTAC